ncbi:hypothetical protein AYK26_06340 [Euryarchaeota archaeon SM23-78]|nr:MAG: hypothetical protein AYK26_06340 [Euryarchaeota archaeon SM23-78]MBW3001054.1 hypothetical protein [Candidatus Woesearchaeota archaeon]
MTRKKTIKDREQALKELKEFILRFKEQEVSYDEFIKHLDDAYKPEVPVVEKPEKILIPVSVFDNAYLSALEAIVKYLHENKGLRFSEIARLLNRYQRAIGVTYRFASKKMKFRLKIRATKYHVPLDFIARRQMSVLESIVYHLRETYKLPYYIIATMLTRDDRTIWTVYQRALKKKKVKKRSG